MRILAYNVWSLPRNRIEWTESLWWWWRWWRGLGRGLNMQMNREVWRGIGGESEMWGMDVLKLVGGDGRWSEWIFTWRSIWSSNILRWIRALVRIDFSLHSDLFRRKVRQPKTVNHAPKAMSILYWIVLFHGLIHRMLHRHLYDSLQKFQWTCIQMKPLTLVPLTPISPLLQRGRKYPVKRLVAHVRDLLYLRRRWWGMNLCPWLSRFVVEKWRFPQMMIDLLYCRPTRILPLCACIVHASQNTLPVPLCRERPIRPLHRQSRIVYGTSLQY